MSITIYYKIIRFRIWEKGTNVQGNLGKIREFQVTAPWMPSMYPWKTIYFWKDEILLFPKIYTFPYLLGRHSSIGNQYFPCFPSTLIPFSQIQNHYCFAKAVNSLAKPRTANSLSVRSFIRSFVSVLSDSSCTSIALEVVRNVYCSKSKGIVVHSLCETSCLLRTVHFLKSQYTHLTGPYSKTRPYLNKVRSRKMSPEKYI